MNNALGKTPYPHSLSISRFLRKFGDRSIFAANFPHLKTAAGHTMIRVHTLSKHKGTCSTVSHKHACDCTRQPGQAWCTRHACRSENVAPPIWRDAGKHAALVHQRRRRRDEDEWWVATSGTHADAAARGVGWRVAGRTRRANSSYSTQAQDQHGCSSFAPV